MQKHRQDNRALLAKKIEKWCWAMLKRSTYLEGIASGDYMWLGEDTARYYINLQQIRLYMQTEQTPTVLDCDVRDVPNKVMKLVVCM